MLKLSGILSKTCLDDQNVCKTTMGCCHNQQKPHSAYNIPFVYSQSESDTDKPKSTSSDSSGSSSSSSTTSSSDESDVPVVEQPTNYNYQYCTCTTPLPETYSSPPKPAPKKPKPAGVRAGIWCGAPNCSVVHYFPEDPRLVTKKPLVVKKQKSSTVISPGFCCYKNEQVIFKMPEKAYQGKSDNLPIYSLGSDDTPIGIKMTKPETTPEKDFRNNTYLLDISKTDAKGKPVKMQVSLKVPRYPDKSVNETDRTAQYDLLDFVTKHRKHSKKSVRSLKSRAGSRMSKKSKIRKSKTNSTRSKITSKGPKSKKSQKQK